MQTLLICLLILYNLWLVRYILSEKRQQNTPQSGGKPPSKPAQKSDGIVGKSLFKMETKVPQASIPEPQAAKQAEGEEVDDIDITFAAGIMQTEKPSSARLPDDKLDEAFDDIRSTDVPQEYDEDDEQRVPTKMFASGSSFEEIGEAMSIADNPNATANERKRAGQIFSEMEGSEITNKIIESHPKLADKITRLMDEISQKPISGEGEAEGNVVQPRNITEVPADISGFDIRDFV